MYGAEPSLNFVDLRRLKTRGTIYAVGSMASRVCRHNRPMPKRSRVSMAHTVSRDVVAFSLAPRGPPRGRAPDVLSSHTPRTLHGPTRFDGIASLGHKPNR